MGLFLKLGSLSKTRGEIESELVVLDPLIVNRAELEGKAFDSPVSLTSNTHLWSWIANEGLTSWINAPVMSFLRR